QTAFKRPAGMTWVSVNTHEMGGHARLSQVDRHTSANKAQPYYCCLHFAAFNGVRDEVSDTPVFKNFSIRWRASFNLSSVAQSEIRMNLLPDSPKIKPGVINTFVP